MYVRLPNPLFLEHRGIRVYQAAKEFGEAVDDLYGFDPYCTIEDGGVFGAGALRERTGDPAASDEDALRWAVDRALEGCAGDAGPEFSACWEARHQGPHPTAADVLEEVMAGLEECGLASPGQTGAVLQAAGRGLEPAYRGAVRSMAYLALLMALDAAACGQPLLTACFQCAEQECFLRSEILSGEVEVFLAALEESPDAAELAAAALEKELTEGIHLIINGRSPGAVEARAAEVRAALYGLAEAFGTPAAAHAFGEAVDRAAAAVLKAQGEKV